GKVQEAEGLDSGFPGKEKNVTPLAAVVTCGRETSGVDRDGVDRDGHAQGEPEKESLPLEHGENRKESTLLRGFHEKKQLKGHLDPSLSRMQSEETSKQHVDIPKSILLTSPSKELKKEAGHVTSQSDPEEYSILASDWSVLPFLGYDWIAGLLDTSPSVAEKPDQYFAELQEFRQANKAECVHEQHLEPKALDFTVPEQETDLITSSHNCVYSYRLNQRLFPVPVHPEAACSICKVPRAL
ncbi:MIIP protein, partial [Alcedo cyanopectus]|nr:MIIP protein [Ceyx cyanopectus]